MVGNCFGTTVKTLRVMGLNSDNGNEVIEKDTDIIISEAEFNSCASDQGKNCILIQAPKLGESHV